MSPQPQLRHAFKQGYFLPDMISILGRRTKELMTQPDVTTIMRLINELAEYENALQEVKATEESLLKTLAFAPFDEGPPSEPSSTPRAARTLLLTAPEGDVAGMALYFYNYSTWHGQPGIYLEDLYVSPKYRRRGYATILLKTLAKEVVDMGGKRLEWCCLKWNEPSLKFYEGIGAKQMNDWVSLRLDGDKLLKLAADS